MSTLTDEQLDRQLERLNAVPWQVWTEALDNLLHVISRLLHGELEMDNSGRYHLVGGYVKYGAHCDRELGGKALYHYQSMVV